MSRLNNNTIISPYQILDRKESFRSQRVFIDASNQTLRNSYKTGGEVNVFIDAADGDIEISLPDAESSTESFNFIRTDNTGSTVDIMGIDGQTISGSDTENLSGYGSVSITSDGQNWWIK